MAYVPPNAGYMYPPPVYPPPVRSDARYAAIIIIGIILILIVLAMIWRLFTDTVPAASGIPSNPPLARPTVPTTPGQASVPGLVPVMEVSNGKRKKSKQDESSEGSHTTSQTASEEGETEHSAHTEENTTTASDKSSSSSSSPSLLSRYKTSRDSRTEEYSTAPGSESRPETLSADPTSSSYASPSHTSSSYASSSRSVEEEQTFFETIDPRTHRHKKAPTINGVVNTIAMHGGSFYAHTVGKGVSGIYKLKDSKWICIIGTANNTSGKHHLETLDTSEVTSVRKIFVHQDGSLCFNTGEKVFRIKDNRAKEIKVEMVRDYHAAEDTIAKITKRGEMYLGDSIARSNDPSIRFRDNAKIRAYEGKLLFITYQGKLVALNVPAASHVTISPRVEAFDVSPDHYIAYSTDRKVILRTPQGTKEFPCGGQVLDIAACSGGVLIAMRV